jgi:mannose-6-phosphate isomerase-like protein (cupin superfamily)
MFNAPLAVLLLFSAVLQSPSPAQRRGATTGPVTFAVSVQDSTGAPLTDVRVSMSGPVARTSRTERGRIVFENLPSGAYHFRFEKDGFDRIERDVTGRGSAPIDVKVTLPRSAPPLEPVRALPPAPVQEQAPGKAVAIDMPAFIEKYYVGRAAGKMTPMACAAGGEATLLQMNDSIAEHAHRDADEFLYVIAGQGAVRLGQRVEALGPGVFMMIPRGALHVITPAIKKPLVVLSIRAGEKCGA